MKKRLMILALMCALLVGMMPVMQARAEEQQEWSNFAEWCAYNSDTIGLDNLPVEYDSSKKYAYVRDNSWYFYLIVWDASIDACLNANGSELSLYNIKDNMSVYKRYYTDGSGWDNITESIVQSPYIKAVYDSSVYYTDAVIYAGSVSAGIVYVTKTQTGQYVQWTDAIAKLTDAQKTKLQSYDHYVVQRNPYRINDWKSEQIMITCSNSSNAIIRGEAYNAICFTTGSGKEAGVSYIYDSHSGTWQVYDSVYAYSCGGTVASGGETPTVLYANVDIYCENGITYAKDAVVWCEACPYDDTVTPTPVPTEHEVVTSGFPRFVEVTDSYAIMYATADTSSTMVAAFSKGKSGVAYGVEYDTAGNAMYKVVASIGGTAYEGYMLASAVEVGYSLPTSGSTDATPTPTITPTPTTAPSGGSTGTGIDDTWYLIEYVVDGETYVGYVLGNWFEDVSGGLTTVVADKVQVFRGRYVTATPQHYLSEGDQVNIKGKYDSVVNDSDFEENINVLVHAVEAVPVLISSVFSFLPDWCLMLVGVVVSVAIVLKLIF